MAQEPQQIIPNEDLPKLVKIAQDKQKYAYGMIYKVVNKSDPDEFYIGSTKSKLRMRWDGHKGHARSNKIPSCQLHVRMREIGHENFQIVLLEEWPCDNRDQLRQREDHWITTLRPCLNKNRAFTSEEEKTASFKQYLEDNAERFTARRQAIYQESRKEILDAGKAYYKQNQAAILLKKRETVHCKICNLDIGKSRRNRHERTQKHKNNMAAVPVEQA